MPRRELLKAGNSVSGIFGVSQDSRYIIGGPHNKDYNILGSTFRSPYFGKLPFGSPTENQMIKQWKMKWGFHKLVPILSIKA